MGQVIFIYFISLNTDSKKYTVIISITYLLTFPLNVIDSDLFLSLLTYFVFIDLLTCSFVYFFPSLQVAALP